MIMTRVKQWGIARNCNFEEMCAAVKLLGEQLGEQDVESLPTDTTFLVRGQPILLSKILGYFRRKGILDPADFVKRLDKEQLDSRDVQLCARGSSAAQRCVTMSSLLGVDSQQIHPFHLSPLTSGHQFSTRLTPSATRIDLAMISPHIPSIQRSLSPTESCERLVGSIAMYVDSYAASDRYDLHQEPTVHHETTHGRFGALMQEGIAQMEPDEAFVSFNNAFGLIKQLVDDDSPVVIAQVLTVMCELIATRRMPVCKSLIKHFSDMSRTRGKAEHTIGVFCATLYNTPDDISTWTVTCIMRKALDTLTRRRGREEWQSLYLKERLCDGLYYADETEQRLEMRQGLLYDQINRYGPNARNVLWTRAMVGDDLRKCRNFRAAIAEFKTVLTGASQWRDFHAAKTRFPAFEGLGLVYLDMARELDFCSPNASVSTIAARQQQKQQYLRIALKHLKDAEYEGEGWFSWSTRRINRVRRYIREAEQMQWIV